MILEQLQRARREQLFETIIQIDTKLRESPAYGKPITSYASGSRAAQQYRALAEELVRAEGAGPEDARAQVEAAGPEGGQNLAVEVETSWTGASVVSSAEERGSTQGRRSRLGGGLFGRGETRV